MGAPRVRLEGVVKLLVMPKVMSLNSYPTGLVCSKRSNWQLEFTGLGHFIFLVISEDQGNPLKKEATCSYKNQTCFLSVHRRRGDVFICTTWESICSSLQTPVLNGGGKEKLGYPPQISNGGFLPGTVHISLGETIS